MTELLDQLRSALGDAYDIERELGGGGMSHVFLATERRLDRQVVIKLLPPDLAGGVSLDRFHREIQLVAKLQNPHIVPVITAGEANGVPFFTMPFVEGRSLRELLKAGTRVSIADGTNILRDVAMALAYAHERGIVHRDIKPDNVLLSGGSAVVTDFGVAKAISSAREGTSAPGGSLTQIGFSLGTPLYMAPEQAAADPATDHRADIYSFGTMAYELFVGTPPFAGRAPAALLAAQMTETPPLISVARPDAPVPLVDLIRRCLEKEATKRPQTALELVKALDQALVSSGSASLGASAPAAPPKSNKVMFAVVFAVMFAIAATAGLLISRRSGGDAAANATRSVAVLPLENVGGSDSDRYFSEGITDELTSALGKIPGLRVASRTSVFALRGKGMDAQQIAKTLKVSSILEGTIRRSGDRLRVTAQLTNANDGLALWSDVYERQMKDVFAVQDDISGAIAGALRVALAPAPGKSGGPPARTALAGTEDLVAYDLYLRGRYFWHQRGSDALHRAAEYFGQAIDRDPTFARAYAGLADALGLLPIYGTTPADSAFPLARKAAERALQLDSTLAEAHTTLGLILKSTGEWEPAAVEFRRSLALDSTYATGHQWFAEVLIITGRVREAVKELERARDLEPLSPVINAELGYTLGLAGRYQEAILAGQRAVELDSTLWTGHAFLAFTRSFAGDNAGAVKDFERAVRLGRGIDPLVGALAYSLAKTGKADSARALLAPVEGRASKRGGSPVALAMGYVGLGQDETALSWLERAAREKDPWLYAMSINGPVFDAI
ncbi:MAG TPA: protein kinase, partial [Gemmatimonadaceae bacterium]|nr:protein kinase [Gemmatimonadaceae bacterium]